MASKKEFVNYTCIYGPQNQLTHSLWPRSSKPCLSFPSNTSFVGNFNFFIFLHIYETCLTIYTLINILVYADTPQSILIGLRTKFFYRSLQASYYFTLPVFMGEEIINKVKEPAARARYHFLESKVYCPNHSALTRSRIKSSAKRYND